MSVNYYEEVTDQVLTSHNELKADADTWGSDTITRMNTLAATAEGHLSILDSVIYNPAFTDDLNYIGPSGITPDYATEPDYSSDGPIAPTLSELNDVAGFDFTDEDYVGLVKAGITTVINNATAGTVIIPSAVFDAMYNRLIADFADEYVTETWTASERAASLGWGSGHSEQTQAALARADDKYSKNLSKARLEEFIKEWTLKHEDIWRGVETGNVFEKVWIDEHNAQQDRALKVALDVVDQAIKINGFLISQDDLALRSYGLQWDSLAKRVGAAAQMFQARVSNSRIPIESENARHAYEQSQVGKATHVEDGETNLAVENAKLVVENSLGTLAQLMQVASNVAMALMSASDVGLSSGTSFGAQEYNNYQRLCCS